MSAFNVKCPSFRFLMLLTLIPENRKKNFTIAVGEQIWFIRIRMSIAFS